MVDEHKGGDRKGDSNDSSEIPDRGETSNTLGLPGVTSVVRIETAGFSV